jgi:hypothetical protein
MIPPSSPYHSPQKEEVQMKTALTVLALVASAAGPAFAGQCPDLAAQMDKALAQRYDAGAANAKVMVKDAVALHQAGKHDESVKMLDDAAKTAGVTLQKKQ